LFLFKNISLSFLLLSSATLYALGSDDEKATHLQQSLPKSLKIQGPRKSFEGAGPIVEGGPSAKNLLDQKTVDQKKIPEVLGKKRKNQTIDQKQADLRGKKHPVSKKQSQPLFAQRNDVMKMSSKHEDSHPIFKEPSEKSCIHKRKKASALNKNKEEESKKCSEQVSQNKVDQEDSFFTSTEIKVSNSLEKTPGSPYCEKCKRGSREISHSLWHGKQEDQTFDETDSLLDSMFFQSFEDKEREIRPFDFSPDRACSKKPTSFDSILGFFAFGKKREVRQDLFAQNKPLSSGLMKSHEEPQPDLLELEDFLDPGFVQEKQSTFSEESFLTPPRSLKKSKKPTFFDSIFDFFAFGKKREVRQESFAQKKPLPSGLMKSHEEPQPDLLELEDFLDPGFVQEKQSTFSEESFLTPPRSLKKWMYAEREPEEEKFDVNSRVCLKRANSDARPSVMKKLLARCSGFMRKKLPDAATLQPRQYLEKSRISFLTYSERAVQKIVSVSKNQLSPLFEEAVRKFREGMKVSQESVLFLAKTASVGGALALTSIGLLKIFDAYWPGLESAYCFEGQRFSASYEIFNSFCRPDPSFSDPEAIFCFKLFHCLIELSK
jgi:hypothetical protein